MEEDGGKWRKMEENEEREVIVEDGERWRKMEEDGGRWRKMEEDEEREDEDGGRGEGAAMRGKVKRRERCKERREL